MVLTQKETTLIKDLKGQEQLCIDKYEKHAACAHDPQLKQLFTTIAGVERGHLNTLNQIANGHIVSDSSVEGPPVPIPNTEVKLYSGDNTCLETSREDSSLPTPLVGDSNAEGPPVPIPNTEVKLCCGDNTCLETDREDSSLPTQSNPSG